MLKSIHARLTTSSVIERKLVLAYDSLANESIADICVLTGPRWHRSLAKTAAARGWADKTIGSRVKFNQANRQFVYFIIDVLDSKLSEQC